MKIVSGQAVSGGRERLYAVDRAKGLAILLVVFGHIVSKGTPPGNEWYTVLKTAIYLFHMPFFIYLSGVAFFYVGADKRMTNGYARWIGVRAERLLLPLLLFGVITVFGKVIAAQYMHVDDVPSSIVEGLKLLLLAGANSPAVSIWYLFVVFAYCVITPLLLNWSGGRIWVWLIPAVILPFFEWPIEFYIDRIFRFYMFFLLGGMVGREYEGALRLFRRFWWPALAVFAVSFVVMALDMPRSVKLLLVGTASLPALHGLVAFGPLAGSTLLLRLGSFAFIVYLLNTIAIGLVRGIVGKFLPWGGPTFVPFCLLLLAAGIFLPILVKVYVLRRIPRLDRMTN